MSQEYLDRIKKAFKDIKKDLENVNNKLSKLEQHKDLVQTQITREKNEFTKDVKKFKENTNSEFEKRIISFHSELRVMNELLRKTELTFKKYVTNSQKKSDKEFLKIETGLSNIDKDIKTTTSNIQILNSRENTLELLAEKNKINIKTVKTDHNKLIKQSEKVVELKKVLFKSINDINLNKIEAKEIKKKVTEDKKQLLTRQSNFEKDILDKSKAQDLIVKNVETMMLKELSLIKEDFASKVKVLNEDTESMKDQILTLEKNSSSSAEQIKLTNKKNRELNTSLNKTNKELEKASGKVLKLTEANRNIGLRVKELERRDDKIKSKLQKVHDGKGKDALNKTKEFLFNLFFEEVEAPSAPVEKKKTKLQK